MAPEELKQALRAAAVDFASAQQLALDTSHSSAAIFQRLEDAFCADSFSAITRNPEWFNRTQKAHSNVPGAFEMQSSNSSDALLMNIFCHPALTSWEGVRELLGFVPIEPLFGIPASVEKRGTTGDRTEIDMAIGDVFVEAKLTEADFTEKPRAEVERYTQFPEVFDPALLEMRDGRYCNYQIIRNILAAAQHGKRHVLLCDARRSDLVRAYYQTLCCVRSEAIRATCRVVFWQELKRVVGANLADFLERRYAIS